MNINEIISSFRRKELEIDCVDMELVQGGGGATPIRYRGKGYLRQTEDDELNFKLYASETEGVDQVSNISAVLSAQPGRLYDENDFYTLTATSSDGVVWFSERIVPVCNWTNRPDPIIGGKLYSITTSPLLPTTSHSVNIHFFDKVNLASQQMTVEAVGDQTTARLDTTRLSAAGVDLIVRNLDTEVIVEVSSQTSIEPTFHTRVQEALIFLTARPVEWRVLVHKEGYKQRLELCSATRRSGSTRLEPPMAPGHAGQEDGWKLFQLYLEYVCKNTPHKYWNHCTYHLHNACEASANSLDVWAVGLSVAIEGIASLIKFENSKEQKELIAELRKWMLEHIRLEPKFSHLDKRLDGHLGTLANVSVKDRVTSLVASGHVSEANVAAWTKLRNRHVHPQQVDLQSMVDHDFQRLIDLINTTTVLLYQILFYLIGYEGRYTDYGTHGYPTKSYPTYAGTSPAQTATAKQASTITKSMRHFFSYARTQLHSSRERLFVNLAAALDKHRARCRLMYR